ncbi:MAG TPA: hypothetical protein VM736_03725, partial [Gemmatimonadales bacterium]|nr:hypothetical protein [Gemmatimonadales bacterium]
MDWISIRSSARMLPRTSPPMIASSRLSDRLKFIHELPASKAHEPLPAHTGRPFFILRGAGKAWRIYS